MMIPTCGTRDLLATRAAATPERTAVVDTGRDREWTVDALDETVGDVAAQLSAYLDGVDSPRVACLLSTRFAFAVTLHASMRTGATLVPLGTDRTVDAVRRQCARTDPDLLVCEAGTEELAVETGVEPILSADDPRRETVGQLHPPSPVDTVERGAVDPDDTVVILFTSGTTGEPKGVRLTARNLTASATAAAFRLGVAPGDIWLCCLAPYHMGGLAPFYRTVLYGTTLALQAGFDADRTARALREYDVTGVSLVPTQLTRLLDAGWSPPPSLATVLLGGAPASASLVERALDAGVPVCPTYGLTETASQVATATPSVAREYPSSVGQPLLFTEVTVLGDGTPVEPGETGELVIDGPTVTPGYLDEERSEAAFGDHGLHTGDVGHRDGDGRLWVVGRLDDTIVTGGENVHPGAVEEILCEHPAVADVAVVGLPDEEWGERVAALVVSDGVSTDELRSFARERLAGYKLPRTIGFTSTLPRTASGTVDRAVVRERLED